MPEVYDLQVTYAELTTVTVALLDTFRVDRISVEEQADLFSLLQKVTGLRRGTPEFRALEAVRLAQ